MTQLVFVSTLKPRRKHEMVCNTCCGFMKPDAIVQAWRNTLEKLVNSKWNDRTQDQRLYDKMLWEPILKIFQVFGSDFPISENYRTKLGDFIHSCPRVGEYPAGDFFIQKEVEHLNKIKKFGRSSV